MAEPVLHEVSDGVIEGVVGIEMVANAAIPQRAAPLPQQHQAPVRAEVDPIGGKRLDNRRGQVVDR